MGLKLNIRLYYAITFLQGMVFYAPIATLYRQAKGLTVFDITLIESISLILMVALEIPWGFAADRIGYKKTIIVCNILFFISKIVFWKADNFGMFLTERLILSVVLSGLSGCDSAYLYLSSKGLDRQKIFGIYEAMSTAGIILSSVIFSAYIKNDYPLSALLTVATYALAMLLSFFLPEARAKSEKHMSFAERIKIYYSAISGNKRFVLFLLAASLISQSNQTITVFLNQLQYLRSGIPIKYMGYLYIVVTFSSFASIFAGNLSAWLGQSKTLKCLFATASISCLIMAFVVNPLISVMGIALLRMSASLFTPISMDIQNHQIKLSDRATILSVYSMVMDIVAVGTNLIYGKLADAGVSFAMGAGGVFCIFGFVLYTIWQRRKDCQTT